MPYEYAVCIFANQVRRPTKAATARRNTKKTVRIHSTIVQDCQYLQIITAHYSFKVVPEWYYKRAVKTTVTRTTTIMKATDLWIQSGRQPIMDYGNAIFKYIAPMNTVYVKDIWLKVIGMESKISEMNTWVYHQCTKKM